MNREIKFRAYDIKNKVYFNDCGFLSFLMGGIRFMWLDYEEDEQMITELKEGDCELLQFTGLKDKNDKEIYEGDIVRAVAREEEYPEATVTSDVIYGDCGQWQVRSRESGEPYDYYSHGLPLNWGGWESIEVIGNVFENPELLEEIV